MIRDKIVLKMAMVIRKSMKKNGRRIEKLQPERERRTKKEIKNINDFSQKNKNINDEIRITSLSLPFLFLKNKNMGIYVKKEKVQLAKIDLHKKGWVYCSKSLYIYIYNFNISYFFDLPFFKIWLF